MVDFPIKMNIKEIIMSGYKRTNKGLIKKDEGGQYHAKYSKDKDITFIHYDFFGRYSHLNIDSKTKLLKEQTRLKKILKRWHKKKPMKVVYYYKFEDSPVLYSTLTKKQKRKNPMKLAYFER